MKGATNMNKKTSWERLKAQVQARKALDVQLAHTVFSESMSSKDGYYEQEDHIAELEELFMESDILWLGSSSSFHNFAVELTKAGRNHSACVVLEKGLSIYPCCVDLLGDYLKYGVDDMNWEKCDKCYYTLKALDRSDWNWRAYSFSIDFLLEKRKRVTSVLDRRTLRTEVLRLAKDFVEKEGSDLAYFDLSNVYCELNRRFEEKATLELAITKKCFSPRCSLRLADIEISAGNYNQALDRLKICQTALKPQADINLAYVFLLKMLCKSSIFLNSILDDVSEKPSFEKDPSAIYKDYNSAIAIGLDGIMQKTAKSVIALIESQTGIKNTMGQSDALGF